MDNPATQHSLTAPRCGIPVSVMKNERKSLECLEIVETCNPLDACSYTEDTRWQDRHNHPTLPARARRVGRPEIESHILHRSSTYGAQTPQFLPPFDPFLILFRFMIFELETAK